MRFFERFANWLGAVIERLVMLSAEYQPAAKQEGPEPEQTRHVREL